VELGPLRTGQLRAVLNRGDEISVCGRETPRVTSSSGFSPPS